MSAREEAEELYSKIYGMTPVRGSVSMIEQDKDLSKSYAILFIDEKIKYHESLFDKGFKDVHIALSSPIKTYLDIMNPLLKHLIEVREELKKLTA